MLEVGCGTGGLVKFLIDHGYEAEGCDISDYAVSVAQKKGLKVIKADAQELPYSDKSFDAVISQHLLEHCQDDLKALKESMRIAKFRVIHVVPGHQSNDPTHVRNHYTADMIEALLAKIEAKDKRYFPDSGEPLDWIILIDLR